ncbi:MAG: class I SAM-dependent methyltransferase [Actinomycetota bacterium]|nr:class I SAM-dependent methyltransferase [Actinomycetota bacterium]
MGRERFETEFGVYSEWLVEACLALGIDPVPGVSRGTGRPALLKLVSAPLDAKSGKLILDLGCGLGGPGAWLARHSGAKVIGIDVMLQSVLGLRRLTPELPAVVASLRALPLRDGLFDAAWSLGVLEMVADKASATREMWRVLRPGAPLVVYDFVSTVTHPGHVPEANRFSPPDHTLRCLEGAGFQIRDAFALPNLPPTPADWVADREAVRAEVRKRHADDKRFKVVEAELQTFRDLVSDAIIEEWIFVASKEVR